MEVYFSGTIDRIIFENASNFFKILLLEIEDTDCEDFDDFEIIVTGTIADVMEGENYTFWGELTQHPKYGEQLKINRYERTKPSSSGLVKYFSSEHFKGIGKKTAEKIVALYGDNTIDNILEDPSKLDSISGLSKVNKERFIAKLKLNYGTEQILAKLAEYGLTNRIAVEIFNAYKDEALTIIQENPYQLVEDIQGVGFKIADQLAEQLGIEADSPQRFRAALVHSLLETSLEQGDTYVEARKLLENAIVLLEEARQIELDPATVAQELSNLIAEDKVQNIDTKIFDNSLFHAEAGIKKHLTRILDTPLNTDFSTEQLAEEITEIENNLGISYDDVQKSAIQQALQSKVFILTGGPGTGKTTVLQSILFALRNKEYCGQEYDKDSILLCAPTGKAAQRMRLSTGWPASTIHRMLGLYGSDDDDMAPVDGVGDISFARVVIVDEASMIDTYLMGALCKALPAGCKLIIVGDVDQLPSIGPGSVFKDIIQSQCLPVARLTSVYRQSEGSRIFDNAKAVITGNYDAFSLTGEDFEFVNTVYAQEESEAPAVLETVRAVLKSGLTPFDFLVLSPMYKGDVGVTALNTRIQEMCNPDGFVVYSGRSLIYKEGDKVLQTVNNYDKNVFNGDVGRIITFEEFEKRFPYPRRDDGREIDADEILSNKEYTVKQKLAASIQKARIANPQTLIDFGEDNIIPYTQAELQEITLAYAMTVHKAQGSEAHTVIQIASTTQHIMLYRQLFYTAMTRARRKLYVVGTEAAIMRACRNVGNTVRRTHLQYFLQLLRYQDHIAKQPINATAPPRTKGIMPPQPSWELPPDDGDEDMSYEELEQYSRKKAKARKEHNDWGRD